jgi:4,5-DOPA dioxygenase extradiol
MHTNNEAQVVYFSHGGGPLPILGDPGHISMVNFMQHLPSQLKKPEAILVISAHWEENIATVLGSQAPSMFYDYYGFPDEAYNINYPAPGSTKLADKIIELLKKNNISAHIDSKRGFDHGLFIPLKLMYPQADIPSVQLSLLRGLNPSMHIDLGKSLRELMHENILIIGSGFSFHNLDVFSWEGINTPDPANDEFQNWLVELCTSSISQLEREKRLIEWQKAPFARYCHPREEHLMPLHICQSIANKQATIIFNDFIMGKKAIAFLW